MTEKDAGEKSQEPETTAEIEGLNPDGFFNEKRITSVN